MPDSFCWKCHHPYEGEIRFKAVCDACGAYLHVCVGCQNYQIGKPNNCKIPGTEQVRDREHFNYCEDFVALSEKVKPQSVDLSDLEKRLFKD